MPILPSEPAINPEDLLAGLTTDATAQHADDPAKWWVLHTKPRQEKALARQLMELGLAYYLPLFPKRHRIRGRLMTAYVPLFDGYVFLWGSIVERQKAFQTNRVVQAINVKDQDRLTQDLKQVKRLIDTGRPIMPVNALEPGDEVEIRVGPLTGLRGTIIGSSRGQRFMVKVDFIQRGAAIEIEDVDLIPIHAKDD